MLVTCPRCSVQFRAKEIVAGKKAQCGSCGHIFIADPANVTAHDDPSNAAASSATSPKELAWTSLYLALAALFLLLVRAGGGNLLASLFLGLAMESAALIFIWRGLRDALLARRLDPTSHLARTGCLVNGVLLVLLGLSAALTIYQLIAVPSSGLPGGLNLNDLQKLMRQQPGGLNDLLKGIQ